MLTEETDAIMYAHNQLITTSFCQPVVEVAVAVVDTVAVAVVDTVAVAAVAVDTVAVAAVAVDTVAVDLVMAAEVVATEDGKKILQL